MVRNFKELALAVKRLKGIIAYEWPAYCKGWENPTVASMIQELELRESRFDGCQLGLTADNGAPILKPWKVYTNCEGLIKELDRHRCKKEHIHQQAEGQHTEKTGFYPERMCRVIIKAIKDDLLGQVSRDAREPGYHTRRGTSVPETAQGRTGETQTSRSKDTCEHRAQECGGPCKTAEENGSPPYLTCCHRKSKV